MLKDLTTHSTPSFPAPEFHATCIRAWATEFFFLISPLLVSSQLVKWKKHNALSNKKIKKTHKFSEEFYVKCEEQLKFSSNATTHGYSNHKAAELPWWQWQASSSKKGVFSNHYKAMSCNAKITLLPYCWPCKQGPLASSGALLTEQLAGAARYGKQPVLCDPMRMASITSRNHHSLLWLPWSRH